ncbi:MAG: protein adenylyltransferase SelO [Bdellovibrionales bacterium]
MKNLFFESQYSSLPEAFYEKLSSTKFPKVELIKWNDSLAKEFSLDSLINHDIDRAQLFSGQKIDYGARPIAQAYSGHQFGHFNPNLGDGRALLLGEMRNLQNVLYDVHLKGSGPTRFSRRGDGKANLAAVVREYLVSESMFHLNIPTSRSLAIISTGETVFRDTPQPGAILVRMAKCHVRIGTFEYFVSRNDLNNAKILADFVIDRLFSGIPKNEEGYLHLLEQIIDRQASLVSKWMNVGFIHGVMNTDNTFISGETLDYGPCAFMEEFNSKSVFSFIDKDGRYAFANQPHILQWNLASLGECFYRWMDSQDKNQLKVKIASLIEGYETLFQKYYLKDLSKKFGFFDFKDFDHFHFQDFFQFMELNKIDFTMGFRRLSQLLYENKNSLYSALNVEWIKSWKEQVLNQGRSISEVESLMNSVNPIYIPRNHLVEDCIQSALAHDFSKLDQLLMATSQPFEEKEKFILYAEPAKPSQRVTNTYCNT